MTNAGLTDLCEGLGNAIGCACLSRIWRRSSASLLTNGANMWLKWETGADAA
ncbi:hypothetical protein ACVIHH_003067 [Bradyrhizobium sp. USDA 4518]